MFLNHKNPRILSFPTAATKGQIVTEINLIPGINEVSAEVIAAMKAHPTLAPMFESGELEVIEDAKDKAVASLSELDEKQALKVVGDCNNPELLKSFNDVEKRPKVKRAIEDRIKIFDNPTDAKAE